jgi:hypothetical protein
MKKNKKTGNGCGCFLNIILLLVLVFMLARCQNQNKEMIDNLQEVVDNINEHNTEKEGIYYGN